MEPVAAAADWGAVLRTIPEDFTDGLVPINSGSEPDACRLRNGISLKALVATFVSYPYTPQLIDLTSKGGESVVSIRYAVSLDSHLAEHML